MSHEEDLVEHKNGAEGFHPKIKELTKSFLADLEEERSRLADDFPLCALLIEEAFEKVFATGRIPGRELHADVLKQKPLKITQKVFVPVKQYPNFNFIGKLLGPKGNSFRRLQEETQCKIAIKGRNSIHDKKKEEELRKSDDPRHNHLNKDLFVEISTIAPPAECYARVAYALAEIRKYLIPDKNDEVSLDQLREVMETGPELVKAGYAGNPKYYKTVLDKPGGFKGTPKYISLLKHAANSDSEDLHEEPQEEPRIVKRPSSYGYKYMKAPAASTGHKHTATFMTYGAAKRLRAVSTKKTAETIEI